MLENRYSCSGLPLWLSWLRMHLHCRRPGFDPWDGKSPWRRERLHTPVFWPGEFHGCIVHGVAKSRTRLSNFTFFLSIVPFGAGDDNLFLPGESHGQRGLVCYGLWGCKKSDTTKRLTHTHTHTLI